MLGHSWRSSSGIGKTPIIFPESKTAQTSPKALSETDFWEVWIVLMGPLGVEPRVLQGGLLKDRKHQANSA